jgi:hypothetical protein
LRLQGRFDAGQVLPVGEEVAFVEELLALAEEKNII